MGRCLSHRLSNLWYEFGEIFVYKWTASGYEGHHKIQATNNERSGAYDCINLTPGLKSFLPGCYVAKVSPLTLQMHSPIRFRFSKCSFCRWIWNSILWNAWHSWHPKIIEERSLKRVKSLPSQATVPLSTPRLSSWKALQFGDLKWTSGENRRPICLYHDRDSD